MARGHGDPSPDPRAGRRLPRRALLGGALVVTGGVAAACGDSTLSPGGGPASRARSGGAPMALVYRSGTTCDGCPEAVADLLRTGTPRFDVVYCGPTGRIRPDAVSLADASLYVQPGGGDDLDAAWAELEPFAPDLRRWVRAGGRYLGICLGGYLAGTDPGLGLLPGDSLGYVGSPGATVATTGDTTVTVDWGDERWQIYFQDGPAFTLTAGPGTDVLARYPNGLVAAAVARYGAGRVGVVGPHPEADASWFASAGLPPPPRPTAPLARQLVAATWDGGR